METSPNQNPINDKAEAFAELARVYTIDRVADIVQGVLISDTNYAVARLTDDSMIIADTADSEQPSKLCVHIMGGETLAMRSAVERRLPRRMRQFQRRRIVMNLMKELELA